MSDGPIAIQLDTGRLRQQMAALALLLQHVPQRRAERIRRKAHRLVFGALVDQGASHKNGVALGAGDLRLQVRVGGLDELIVAALCAAKCDFHGGTRAV